MIIKYETHFIIDREKTFHFKIPEFDNFYLDMNGIIHACSHINDDNCATHVTEEEIFRNIFHYLDVSWNG